MMVLSNKCRKCKHICNAMHIQQNFENWTSGNNDIDKFIQVTQLSAHHNMSKVLEWIPYNRFYDIKHIAERKVYEANWIDGCIYKWDDENQNWEREGCELVILKSLNN